MQRSRRPLISAAYGFDLQSQRDGFAATGAKAVFLVFDACRNLPGLGGYKSGTKGLARVDAAADMLIAYSTGLGDVAKEGLYAPVLAEEIVRPGQNAEDAFAAAQRRVASLTNRKQLPWTNNQLYTDLCFSDCDIAPALPQAEPFELVMSGPELDGFFKTAFETYETAAKYALGNESYAMSPGFAVKFDAFTALVSKGKNADDSGASTGNLVVQYIKGTDLIGEWSALVAGNSFGEPPDYTLRTGLLTYPAVLVRSFATSQGYTLEWIEMIEITPDGPVKRGDFQVYGDNAGVADAARACVIEGKIRASPASRSSFSSITLLPAP